MKNSKMQFDKQFRRDRHLKATPSSSHIAMLAKLSSLASSKCSFFFCSAMVLAVCLHYPVILFWFLLLLLLLNSSLSVCCCSFYEHIAAFVKQNGVDSCHFFKLTVTFKSKVLWCYKVYSRVGIACILTDFRECERCIVFHILLQVFLHERRRLWVRLMKFRLIVHLLDQKCSKLHGF